MDERAVKIIAEHEFNKTEKLIKEFESLKPKPYRGLMSSVALMVTLFIYQYFSESSIFENGGYFFFIAIMASSGAIELESKNINKRIDLLVKLIKSGSIKPEKS
ncbi:MAG: hypothetical protein COA86_18890 [Kangiella sp.]|nr:MAG: hypothetical protein COA86_18890 [Kangiella sp.]